MTRTPANIVAAFALALPLFAISSHAEDAIKPADGYRDVPVSAQHPMPRHKDEQLTVSDSRINGRTDWDVDYPSQLAPQALPMPDTATSRTSE